RQAHEADTEPLEALAALGGGLRAIQEPGVVLDAVLDVRRCRRAAGRQQRQAENTNDCRKSNPHVTPSFAYPSTPRLSAAVFAASKAFVRVSESRRSRRATSYRAPAPRRPPPGIRPGSAGTAARSRAVRECP